MPTHPFRLPTVDFVYVLQILRLPDPYRTISVVEGLQLMIEALPCLQYVQYEPWRGVNDARQYHMITQYGAFITVMSHCKHLRRVHIFEPVTSTMSSGLKIRTEALGLGPLLARRSAALEALIVCFAVNAMHFFWDLRPTSGLNLADRLYWANLREVLLTSDELQPRSPSTVQVIDWASRAVARMPQIQIMEIFNVETRKHVLNPHATIFAYVVLGPDQFPAIIVSSTWGWRLQSTEIWPWAHVASMDPRTRAELRVQYVDLKREDLPRTNSVFCHLAMCDVVRTRKTTRGVRKLLE
ncbi:Uu.00g086990.m01.CDS01 [Anthostomella pinea]|uniref:Uu.00g086990.m01.CDS01 n=1 Tax=Anthostomella pinea TaxID=933095 RepID=A0AAI8VMB8_9PEZI|nr:Uu.00g086990.m01.CDS01 [Anthostomella pinea]